MNLIEIENLTFADLKAKKAELVEAAKTADVGELAARYVQARTDATCRDEKLAEQGTTITALQEALADLKAKLLHRVTEADGLKNDLSKSFDSLKQEREAFEKLKANLIDVAKERDAALQLAKARRAALADVMSFAGQLNDRVAKLLAAE